MSAISKMPGNERHEAVLRLLTRAARRDDGFPERQARENRLDLIDRAVLESRDPRGALSRQGPQMPEHPRLGFREQMPHEGDEFLAQGRAHQQGIRQPRGGVQVNRRHAGKITPSPRLDRWEPGRRRADDTPADLNDLASGHGRSFSRRGYTRYRAGGVRSPSR